MVLCISFNSVDKPSSFCNQSGMRRLMRSVLDVLLITVTLNVSVMTHNKSCVAWYMMHNAALHPMLASLSVVSLL